MYNKKRQEILESKQKQLKEKKTNDLQLQFQNQLYSLKSKAREFERDADKHMNNSNKYMREAQAAERKGNSVLAQNNVSLGVAEKNAEERYRQNSLKLKKLHLEIEMQMKTTALYTDFEKLTKTIQDTMTDLEGNLETKNVQFDNALDKLKQTSKTLTDGPLSKTEDDSGKVEKTLQQVKDVVEFEKNQHLMDSIIISEQEIADSTDKKQQQEKKQTSEKGGVVQDLINFND